jgi:hypothetical protein
MSDELLIGAGDDEHALVAPAPRRFLTAQEVEAADDLPCAELEVPEWGGWLRVRALSLNTYLSIKESAAQLDGSENERELTVSMLSAALVDENGHAMFDREGAARLLDKSATAVGKVMQAIARVAGVSPEAVLEAERTFRAGESG